MKIKKILTTVLILFLLVLATTGCVDLFKSNEQKGTTYVKHPYKIEYTLSYGYIIKCSGEGTYEINYDCDLPEVLLGAATVEPLNSNSIPITLSNNSMLRWNITGEKNNNYKLGIKTNVVSTGFVESDLSGEDALTINQIKNLHPDIYNSYTQSQSNETKIFIDPDDAQIKSTAEYEVYKAESNNSFIIAKQLFIWLKEKTYYQIHLGELDVQPACITMTNRNGDCDDLSFLYISLCRAVDIPARFIKGFLVEKTDNYVQAVPHAWVEVFVGGNMGNKGWIPVECACRSEDIEVQINQQFGRESAGHLRLFTDNGTDNSLIVSLSDIRVKYDISESVDINPMLEIESYEVLEQKELIVEDNNRYYK